MKELILELKSQNIFVSVDGEELVVDFDGDELSQDLISKIKANKHQLINYLIKYQDATEYIEIPKITDKESYKMSDSQRRLWSLSQFEESSVAYNLPGHTFLDQSINVENF
ncbi:MAG: hypothetical protein WBA74_06155, partial [Cyclobacteriaceae bacterium]